MRAQPITPSPNFVPRPPQRTPRNAKSPAAAAWDRAFEAIALALWSQGGGYSSKTLAEDIGVPEDMVKRLAARAIVEKSMVQLGLVDPEDAIRIGSEALAASLRLARITYADDVKGSAVAARVPLRPARARGLRRINASAPETRLVAAPRTSCPRCETRSEFGCVHQHIETAE